MSMSNTSLSIVDEQQTDKRIVRANFNVLSSRYRCCCGCCLARTGAVILSTVEIIIIIVRFYTLLDHHMSGYSDEFKRSFTLSFWLQMLVLCVWVVCIFCFFVGCCMERPRLILPFIVFRFLLTVLVLIVLGLLIYSVSRNDRTSESNVDQNLRFLYGVKVREYQENGQHGTTLFGPAIGLVIVQIFMIAYNIWFLLILRALYRYLIDKLYAPRVNLNSTVAVKYKQAPRHSVVLIKGTKGYPMIKAIPCTPPSLTESDLSAHDTIGLNGTERKLVKKVES